MEHVFIVNPAAGNGRPLKFIPRIEGFFKKIGEKYKLVLTERPGHATLIAREYAGREDLRVYSVGGDGTLNEILNGMAGKSSSLAVIPGGSGNDFVRSICARPGSEDILTRTVKGEEKLVDLATINDRYFINISSVGFDAQVAVNTSKYKRSPFVGGSLAYLAAVLETLRKYKSSFIKMVIDGKRMEFRSLLAAVANGRYYGGGMKAVPSAEIDDGMLDVCVIEEKSRLEILKFLPRFIKGRHGDIQGVHFFRGKHIELECESEMPLNVDGETHTVKNAIFKVIPRGIRIVVPTRCSEPSR